MNIFASNQLPEVPSSTWHVTADETDTSHWELRAALAVLARARATALTLRGTHCAAELCREAQLRLQTAERLVAQIRRRLNDQL